MTTKADQHTMINDESTFSDETLDERYEELGTLCCSMYSC